MQRYAEQTPHSAILSFKTRQNLSLEAITYAPSYRSTGWSYARQDPKERRPDYLFVLAGIRLNESGLLRFMWSRIFFSFLRMLSLVTLENFFFCDGLGQSHSSTLPYCSSISFPEVRFAFRRSKSGWLRLGEVSCTPLLLAIIREGGAKKRFPLPALDSFILANFISGHGILPD